MKKGDLTSKAAPIKILRVSEKSDIQRVIFFPLAEVRHE